jgi:hypothetical protein
MEHDTRIRKSRRSISVEDDAAGDENPHSITAMVTPGGLSLSEAEKSKTPADSLEAQFQQVTAPSEPAVIVMADVELDSYFQIPAMEPILTNPEEV